MYKPNAVTVSRDPFARIEIVRITEVPPASYGGCAWCGNTRKGGKLFRYGTETDAGTQHWQNVLVCSLQCARNYFGF